MILLFTDFSWHGPYVGELHIALAREAPGVPIVDLLHDAPAFSPIAAGHLLAALTEKLPQDAVVVAVVDPGVGSQRRALLLEVGGRRFVGPDNGLLAPLAARYSQSQLRVIDWRPEKLSSSFHGRDLFAPVAARLALGVDVASTPLGPAELVGSSQPVLLAEIIYIDGYGNAWTGLPSASVPRGATLSIDERILPRARTFSDMEKGQAFWYENSAGLIEIAVNQDSAVRQLGLQLGARISIRAGDKAVDDPG